MKAVSGPQPSDVKVVCSDCGAVRWMHPHQRDKMKSHRCKRCASRATWGAKKQNAVNMTT